jgi:uncharacterized protein (TIGR01370 family)
MVPALVVLLALLLLPAPAAAETPERGLENVDTWGFAIGSGTLRGDLSKRYAGYDLLVVDGQEAKPGMIAELQAEGTVVLGYLSVGTIEDWRPWYERLKPYRIEAWKDWEGEYYARVSERGFRRQITRHIAPKLYEKGFDGLFLDNVDMIEVYRHEAAGMRKLVAALGRLVHADGGLLFAQNGYSIIGPMLDELDGWNREDVTGTFNFNSREYAVNSAGEIRRAQRELAAVGDAGLLTLATDYTARAGSQIADRAVANACEAGALPYVSDIGLRRTPKPPLACAG